MNEATEYRFFFNAHTFRLKHATKESHVYGPSEIKG